MIGFSYSDGDDYPVTQIFTKAPTIYKIKPTFDIKKLKDIKKVFVHSSFLINLCKNTSKFSIASVLSDMIYLSKLGNKAGGLVIHVGNNKESSEDKTFKILAKNLELLVRGFSNLTTKKCPLICIENRSYKQGTYFSDVYQYKRFHDKYIKNNKKLNKIISFCFDTCHEFNSMNLQGTTSLIERFNFIFNYISVVHLNDAKNLYLDRHEDIFEGLINKDILVKIIKKCSKHDVPMIIERQYNKKTQLNKIKELKL